MTTLSTPLVKDYMVSDYPKVDKDDTLQYALKVMERYGTDRVLAFEKDRLVGILTKKDIIVRLGTLRTRSITPSHLYVSSVMTSNPVTICPEDTLIEASKTMINRGISSLPVVDSGRVVGLITKREIARLCIDKSISIPTKNIMSYNPITLKPGDRVIHARQVILLNSISTLPVVENDKPVGLVTVDEVAKALIAFYNIVPARYRKERIMHLLVDDIMKNPIKVHMETPLYETVKVILDKKVRGIIVVDSKNTVTGVVTLTDIVRYISSELNI